MGAISALHVPLKDMNLDALRDELDYCNRTLFDDSLLIRQAMDLACWAHRNQTRKWRKGQARTPYAEHPLRCALRLIRAGYLHIEIVVAALLHDVVEDCSLEIANDLRTEENALDSELIITDEAQARGEVLIMIAESFGDEVGRIIKAVTNPLIAPDEAKRMSKLVKQDMYEQHIEELVASGDLGALLVKISDMLDNAGSLQHQYGHVEDSMISRLVRKYTLPLKMLSDGLIGVRLVEWDPAHSTLLISLNKTRRSLIEIELDMQRLKSLS